MIKKDSLSKKNQISNLITHLDIQNPLFFVSIHPNLPTENSDLIALQRNLTVPSQTSSREFTKLSVPQQQQLLNLQTISKIDSFMNSINQQKIFPAFLSIAAQKLLNRQTEVTDFMNPNKNGWFRIKFGIIEFISDVKYKKMQKKQAALALHHVQNVKTNKISKKLKISLETVGNLLKKFKQSPIEVLDLIKTNDLKPVEELRLVSIINEILQSQQHLLSAQRIKVQLEDHFQLQFSKSFRINRFLKTNGFRYKKIRKHRPATVQVANSKQAFLSFVLDIIIQQLPLFYFDVSTVVEGSFAKKSWYRQGSNFAPTHNYRYDYIHIMGLISSTGIIGIKFLRGRLCHLSIACFFIDSMTLLRQKIPNATTIHVVIDNAPMNKSTILKKLCTIMNIVLIYIVPSTPELNPIELFWRDIKLGLRKEYYLSRNKIYDKILEKCKSLQESSFIGYQRTLMKQWKEMRKEGGANFEFK